jgi:hypothetical protein
MDKTRGVFFGLIALALVGVGAGAYVRYSQPAAAPAGPITAIPAKATEKPAAAVNPAEAPAAAVKAADTPAAVKAANTPAADAGKPEAAQPIAAPDAAFAPIFAPNVTNELPKYVCGAYSVGSYHTLLQIQTSGIDIANDFHLGIVPFYLNDKYTNSEAGRAKMLQEGKIDCLLTTIDAVAGLDHGVVTGIVDESAGADQVWSKDNVATLNDLKGKRIAYEASGHSEYFAHYLLQKIGLKNDDAILLAQPTINDAIAVFNKDEADVVVGWEPAIFDAEKSGGRMLVSTREFRPIMDVIVTNRDVAKKRSKVVERFHEAWFEALIAQAKDFNGAARQVAAWGNNAWSGVSVDAAADDWRVQLDGFAQANMQHNKTLMNKPELLIERINEARELLAESGTKIPARPAAEVIEPKYVLRAIEGLESAKIGLNIKLINNSFAYGQETVVASTGTTDAPATGVAPNAPATTVDNSALLTEVAALPCTRFEFIPNTTKLLPESQKLLDDCALKTMRESTGVFMRVKASSAWPGPRGTFTQQQVEDVAKARAQAIADYLSAKGVDPQRFVVEWVLPPEERRETTDLKLQAQDRYVELALLISGL